MFNASIIIAATTPPFDRDAMALFRRMVEQPTAVRKRLVSDLIVGMKRAGIWDRLDSFYMPSAHTEQAAKLNWRSFPAYDLVAVNSPAFTVDKGWMGDGVASYLDTGMDRGSLSYYQQNSATIFSYENITVSLSAAYTVGLSNIDQARIVGRTAGGSIGWRINDSNSLALATGTGNGYGPGSAGLAAVSRSGATARTGYKNGLVGISDAEPSVSGTGRFYLLRQAATYAARNISVAGFGASLTDAQHATLFSLIQTYLRGVGNAITPT